MAMEDSEGRKFIPEDVENSVLDNEDLEQKPDKVKEYEMNTENISTWLELLKKLSDERHDVQVLLDKMFKHFGLQTDFENFPKFIDDLKVQEKEARITNAKLISKIANQLFGAQMISPPIPEKVMHLAGTPEQIKTEIGNGKIIDLYFKSKDNKIDERSVDFTVAAILMQIGDELEK